MKNFLGKLRNIKTEKKVLYFSAFILICFFVAMPVCSAHAGSVVTDLVDAFVGGAETLICAFIYWAVYVVFKFVSFLVYFAAWLVDMMLNPALYKSILVGTLDSATGKYTGAVQTGWQTVRDFCNMFYIFFLLLMAFATIVGNQTYSAKALMPKFIISLFLINFSDVITKMVIDVGQVFLFGMAAWLGTFSGSSGGGSSLSAIIDYFELALSSKKDIGFSSIITIIFATLYTFFLGGVYLVLAAFLAIRLVMFASLIIMSPFAFFSMVLPSMRKYTSQWTSSLISNAISGPVLIFFVYISAMMAKTLVDNPIAITIGDTSKMADIGDSILARIVPHMVALGILLYGITVAKAAGSAGSGLYASAGGGRFGMGNALMAGYAGFKLGERGVKGSASKAGRGLGWAKDAAVRNSSTFAGVENRLHGAAQKKVGEFGGKHPIVAGTATGVIARDMARQDAARQKMSDDRLKKYGGNLKALDVDLLSKGDNVDKALALKAAAEQGKLGDPALATHFNMAQSVMSNGDIKNLTSKNLAFNTLTNANRSRRSGDGSFNADAELRIADAVALGIAPDRAVKDEIMREKFMGLIDDGEDGKIQDLGDKNTAKIVTDAYTKPQLVAAIKKMSKKKKNEYREGMETNTLELEAARGGAAPAVKQAIEKKKIEYAVAATRAGSDLQKAIALNEIHADFDDHAEKFFKKADTGAISGMQDTDLEKFGHHADADKIKDLYAQKEIPTMQKMRKAIDAQPAPRSPEMQKRYNAVHKYLKL
ncbi:MAG: hypothetical protein WCQ96_00985 [Patescibacteria group bacterium]